MTPHSGHRNRLREKYKKFGPGSMSDTDLAEFLLCYTRRRVDVRPLAVRLVEEYGGFAGIAGLSREELESVDGVGEKVSVFVRLICGLSKLSLEQRRCGAVINSLATARRYFAARFGEITGECAFVSCLDDRCRLVSCVPVCFGPFEPDALDASKLIDPAIDAGSHRVIVAHNRADLMGLPSDAEKEMAERLESIYSDYGVELLDYLVFFHGRCISAAAMEFLRHTSSRLNYLNPAFPGSHGAYSKSFRVMSVYEPDDWSGDDGPEEEFGEKTEKLLRE